MTVLGKILAIFVFLLSLFWFGLTAVLFNARTEWRDAAISAQTQANINADAADEIRKANAAELSAMKAQLDKANQTIGGLKRERDAAQSRNEELTKTFGIEQDAVVKKLPEVVTLISINQTLQQQNDIYVNQARTLGAKVDDLAIKNADATRKQNDAELAANSLKKALDDKGEQLRTALEERLGTTAGGGALDFRGDVITVNGSIVVFSGGINAGVKQGMKFNVTRAESPYYIGTVIVNIDPDTRLSAGVFTPIAGQPLKAPYLPKVGDSIVPATK
jgi:hypothetical protein